MVFLKFCAKLLYTLFLAVIVISCRSKVVKLKSPPHYKFSEAFEYKLDLKIREISGVYWNPAINEFLANNDESGKIFYLDKDTKMIKADSAFAGKGDYEDITMAGGVPYILRSDGMITKITHDSTGRIYGMEIGKLGLSGTNDFETMYYDESRHALILICKNCALDDKTKVSAFAYYLDSTGFDTNPVFVIDADKVRLLAPQKSSKFQPSAAAVHPILKQLFILSSASNQLAVADLNGNILSVHVLAKKMFPQPEGITFKKNGEMYISNEGVTSKATLIQFRYIP